MQPQRKASSLQFVHRCTHLSELPINWHPPHATPQIEQRASLGQDGSSERAGLPKGPPLPLCPLV